MAVKVYSADPYGERDTIVDVLARFLTKSSGKQRFERLYLNNPYGRTHAWLAVDEANKSIIGAAAAFPRRFYWAGDEIQGWVLGDFCLDPNYRSLGPALQLQRACLGLMDFAGGTFCYDFPSASMLAVYKRLGFSVTGRMLRLAKPLRVDRKVKELIKSPAVQCVVSAVGNTLLKVASRRREADENLEVVTHQGLCGEEFTTVAQEHYGKFDVYLKRSAEYLNWRYLRNLFARHEIVTARRDGRLIGYAVWTQAREDASIVDLFGEEDAGMVGRLVTEIAACAENRGVMTLSVSINESHPWLSLFSEMGFRFRDSVPVVIIPSNTFAGEIDLKLARWYLMQGDRDS